MQEQGLITLSEELRLPRIPGGCGRIATNSRQGGRDLVHDHNISVEHRERWEKTRGSGPHKLDTWRGMSC
jgi:hypothetical protein